MMHAVYSILQEFEVRVFSDSFTLLYDSLVIIHVWWLGQLVELDVEKCTGQALLGESMGG